MCAGMMAMRSVSRSPPAVKSMIGENFFSIKDMEKKGKIHDKARMRYYRKNIGMQIQSVREMLKVSRAELAQRTGITEETIRKVEEGRYNVQLDTLTAICDEMDYEIWIGMKF